MASPVKSKGKWRIRWTDETGRRRSEVFVKHGDAARELKLREAEVEEIKRGSRTAILGDRKLEDVFQYWIDHRVPEKRSGGDDLSIIKGLRPLLGGVRLRDLSLSHIHAYEATKTHLSRKTVTNHLTLLTSLLNTALELGWVAKAIKIRKPRISGDEEDLRYLRTIEERDRFLRAAKADGEDCFVLYATAAFTGMRAGELAGMRWADVDFEKRLITVQRSFDGPTKSNRVRHVPVLDALLPTLREWRLKQHGTYVFTNRDGHPLRPSGRVFQERFHRVLEAAELRPAAGSAHKFYMRFHDLRHSFASHWMMSGGDLFKLQRILGHQSAAMTQRYSHLAPDAFVNDHSRLGGAPIVESANVVPLNRAFR